MFFIVNPGEIPTGTIDLIPPNAIEVFPRNEKPELTHGNEGWAMSVATIDPDNVWRFDWLIVQAPDIPPAPNPAAFYHAVQASLEFAALDAWAIVNPADSAAVLLDRTMAVTLEAKAYSDQFGGNATSFAAMEARLLQFIAALDDATDYGGTDKAAILARIKDSITFANLPIEVV